MKAALLAIFESGVQTCVSTIKANFVGVCTFMWVCMYTSFVSPALRACDHNTFI